MCSLILIKFSKKFSPKFLKINNLNNFSVLECFHKSFLDKWVVVVNWSYFRIWLVILLSYFWLGLTERKLFIQTMCYTDISIYQLASKCQDFDHSLLLSLFTFHFIDNSIRYSKIQTLIKLEMCNIWHIHQSFYFCRLKLQAKIPPKNSRWKQEQLH